MSSPESIAAAFARGLMEGLLRGGDAAKVEKKPKRERDEVRSAVRDEIASLLANDVSRETTDQLDLFAAGIAPPTGMMGTYDPNIGATEDSEPWQSPSM